MFVLFLTMLIFVFFINKQNRHLNSTALIIGFILGAYSSIFIASTLLAWWRRIKEKTEDKNQQLSKGDQLG